MRSPYGQTTIQGTSTGNSARLLEPPTFYARGASTANIADLSACSVSQDGLTLVETDLFFVYNQTAGAENGLYVVGPVSGGLAALTRAYNMDSSVETMHGTLIHVQSGTANAGKTFKLTNAMPIVIGTDALTFVELVTGTAGVNSVGVQKRSVTVGHADLTAAAVSQAINIGAVLPANAQILGVTVALATTFSGGGASAVSVDIGTTGDVDALIDGSNLFAAAVDGQASTRPLGIAPNKLFVAAGAQLIATFIADVNVADLSAGACTITVSFAPLA